MRRVLEAIEGLLLGLAALALLLMMAATSIDALGRELFAHPLQGNFEVTGLYFMVILVFATLSCNYGANHHIRVDVFVPYLKRRLGHYYDRLIAAICLPVFAFFAWHASIEVAHKFEQREAVMGIVHFPVTLSYVWVAAGALTLSVRFLLDVLSPQDTPPGTEAVKRPRA